MNFETISLLLSWVELGVLLAILLRLGRTFELIAGTQRELRRAIHRLAQQRADNPGMGSAFGDPGVSLHSGQLAEPINVETTKDKGDFIAPVAVR